MRGHEITPDAWCLVSAGASVGAAITAVGRQPKDSEVTLKLHKKIKINSPLKLKASTSLMVMRTGQYSVHFLCAVRPNLYVNNVLNPFLYVFLLGYFKVYKVTYANCPKQGL